MSRRRGVAAVTVVLLATVLVGVPDAGGEDPASLVLPAAPTPLQERRLVQGLFDIWQGRLDEAAVNVGDVVRQQPDFRLARLIQGDLLSAFAGQLRQFGRGASSETLQQYRHEAEARLGRYLSAPPVAAVPKHLLRLPASSRSALLVDVGRYRLYLFDNENGRAVRSHDYYVSIGKGGGYKLREGDEKTPIGVYRVTRFLPGSTLPDLYGVGAFPIDYPNGWDRLRGRTGSGIWLHGTESDRYSRPPLSSLGCVTLSNEDFRQLAGRVEIGRTPVVVTDELEWTDRGELEAERQALEAALEGWRRDWESRDVDRYLSHYAHSFRTQGMSREAFAAHKRRVNAGKRYIRVGVEEIGIFRYPGEDALVVIEFLQRYESDSFRAQRRKQQYWRNDGDGWRIVFEDSV